MHISLIESNRERKKKRETEKERERGRGDRQGMNGRRGPSSILIVDVVVSWLSPW